MRAINILSIFATLCIFCKSFALSDIGVDPLEEDLYGGGGFDGYDEYRDDYQGKRPDITELHSSDEIDEFLKSDEFAPKVVGYFDANSAKDELAAFQEVADQEGRNYRFAFTTDKETLEGKKYDFCAVLVYPPSKFVNEKFERSRFRFPGKSISNSNAFVDFVRHKALPLVGEFNSASEGRYINNKRPVSIVYTKVDHARNPKGFQYVANRIRKIAKDYSNDIVFAIANLEDYSSVLETDYGVEEVNPKKTYATVKDSLLYTLEDEFSFEKFAKFVQDYKSGKLVGREKPSPEPSSDEINYAGTDVIQLSNDNFATVVEESNADVMLEFYAPWCGHCKSLSPEYKSLASHFRSDAGITVAAMDATAENVPPKYNVEGYPSLYFVPADSKQPVIYDGERSLSEMIAFIEQHRTSAKEEL